MPHDVSSAPVHVCTSPVKLSVIINVPIVVGAFTKATHGIGVGAGVFVGVGVTVGEGVGAGGTEEQRAKKLPAYPPLPLIVNDVKLEGAETLNSPPPPPLVPSGPGATIIGSPGKPDIISLPLIVVWQLVIVVSVGVPPFVVIIKFSLSEFPVAVKANDILLIGLLKFRV